MTHAGGSPAAPSISTEYLANRSKSVELGWPSDPHVGECPLDDDPLLDPAEWVQVELDVQLPPIGDAELALDLHV